MAKEYRVAGIDATIHHHSSTAPGEMTLVGWPVVYDTPTTITDPNAGTYTEIIERGALDETDLRDSTLIYNHDDNRVPLARSPRTMKLTVTERGLRMVAELADDNQTATEVYSAVRRGDLSGMSFAFTVPEGGSSYDPATNTRRIKRIAKIYEVSVVPFPAYPTTSVEARDEIRAAHDLQRAEARSRAERIQALIRASRIIKEN